MKAEGRIPVNGHPRGCGVLPRQNRDIFSFKNIESCYDLSGRAKETWARPFYMSINLSETEGKTYDHS
jgi:hypothetical protein